MSVKIKHRCARCGKRIKKGGACYRFKAELISHFDGYIQYDRKTDMKEMIEEISEQTQDMSSEEIERQVYEKFDYIVCPPCRDEIGTFLRAEEG